jgi:hypothetical protein
MTWGHVRSPGNRRIYCNALNPEFPIKGYGRIRNYIVPFLDKTGIHVTVEIIKERIGNREHCPILMTGDPGDGKSTAIHHIALGCHPSYDVDDIAFTLEAFDQKYQDDSKPQINMDEAAAALYGDEWMKEEQRTIAKNLLITRILQKTVYFAAAKPIHLNPRVRNLTNMWIHVSRPDAYSRGYAVVRLAPPEKQSEFSSGKFWEPKYAFIFPEMTGPFWDRYSQAKLDFVRDTLKNPKRVLKRTIDLDTYEQLKAAHFTDEWIGQRYGVTRNAIEMKVSRERKKLANQGLSF